MEVFENLQAAFFDPGESMGVESLVAMIGVFEIRFGQASYLLLHLWWCLPSHITLDQAVDYYDQLKAPKIIRADLSRAVSPDIDAGATGNADGPGVRSGPFVPVPDPGGVHNSLDCTLTV